MFKNIDKKFEEIGFIKTEENEYQVIYERENEFFNLEVDCLGNSLNCKVIKIG